MKRLIRQIETAAAWAMSFRLEQAPQDVIALSTWQIANIMAALLAGSRSGAGEKIWRAMQGTMQPGPCTVIPHGERVSLWDALYIHAAFASALELDDFLYRGHIGKASILVPLSMAECNKLDSQAVLRAQIVANELAGRLGWVTSAEIFQGHQRTYLLRFAAAAAAGILLDLSEKEFANALAISITQPELALHPGMFSPDTKVLAGASSVVEGVRAAYFAKEGLTGTLDILEHRAGFYRQFTMNSKAQSPFVQMGEAWCTHALSFKRYSSCAYASGIIDAAREIHAQPEFNLDEIERIEVASSLPALILERLAKPHEPNTFTPVNVHFSIVRCAAAALALGELRGYHFMPDVFPTMIAHIRHLSTRSRLVHDWKYTIHQLRGIDAGLNKGGSKNSADTLQFYRTCRVFRSMFGSVRAIGLSDVIKILNLPKEERNFFLKRWERSLRSYFHRSQLDQNGEYRPLGDLRRLSFRMGGSVTVTLKGGKTLSAERIIPTGMAGDPNREAVVKEKLLVEGERILGREKCEQLWEVITGLQVNSPIDVIALASGTKNEISHVKK